MFEPSLRRIVAASKALVGPCNVGLCRRNWTPRNPRDDSNTCSFAAGMAWKSQTQLIAQVQWGDCCILYCSIKSELLYMTIIAPIPKPTKHQNIIWSHKAFHYSQHHPDVSIKSWWPYCMTPLNDRPDPSPWHIKSRWLLLLLEQRQSMYKSLASKMQP